MRAWKTSVAILIACLVLVGFVSAESRLDCSYTVHSKGMRIGTVDLVQQDSREDGVKLLHFESRTRINASLLWFSYRQNILESGTVRNGALIAYARSGEDNGRDIDIKGHVDNGAFRFEVREPNGVRRVVIPRHSYDSTTMECPEARLEFKGTAPVTVRILDVEHLAVVDRQYRLVGLTQYQVAGKSYPCRIIEFKDRNKRARRWLSQDGTMVTMFRQDGSGDSASYSVRAISVKRGE